MSEENCEKSYDDYEDPLLNVVAKVLHEADDDRLPDDTLWYADGCTLADALVHEIRDVIEGDTAGDVSEESTDLEPAAWAFISQETNSSSWDGATVSVSTYRRDAESVPSFAKQEPLVRLSDVISVLEIVEREAEAYTTAEEEPVMAFKHGSELVLANIRELLEEFTQKGDSAE